MDEETQLKYWGQIITAPILWESKARALARAAEVLHERTTQATNTLIREQPASGSLEANRLITSGILSMFPVAYMLAGLAIENAIKGVRIGQLGTDDPYDPACKGHFYARSYGAGSRYYSRVNGQLDRRLLEKLQQYVTWLGRSAKPKRPNNYMKEDPDLRIEMFPVSQHDWWPSLISCRFCCRNLASHDEPSAAQQRAATKR